ncbi:hypothetical protein WN55_08871 [Dufourea novaeangliae]|uniref:Uncharacterized protein n=1 Tax=Dufourea novaeangliae TaxID=178035 RepID=A0A154P521_DUFNO|nr:hypothetical protein WN55_08871 [Dufourea novaeangliae]
MLLKTNVRIDPRHRLLEGSLPNAAVPQVAEIRANVSRLQKFTSSQRLQYRKAESHALVPKRFNNHVGTTLVQSEATRVCTEREASLTNFRAIYKERIVEPVLNLGKPGRTSRHLRYRLS